MTVKTRKSTKARTTRTRSKASNSQVDQAAFAALAEEEYIDLNVLEYGSECMTKYGLKTLEGRAIPDYRDGLIPVQRRILWAMSRLPKTLVKSARVVGDVIGKYHPHGDTAVYGSLVTMVQAPAQFVIGEGNWGSYDNPKSVAAMRYTECKLSPLARAVFFSGSLTKAYDLVPNFDGSEKEPVLLHCNIPVALVLGKMSGIAVGLTCDITSFTLESVIKVSRMALMGKTITPKICRENLEFKFSWGGKLNPAHLKDGSYNSVLSKGRGRLTFLPDYEYDEKTNILMITGMPPKLSYETACKNTVKKGYSYSDGTTVDSNGKLEIQINLRKGRDKVTQANLDEVLKIWSSETISVRVSTVERTVTEKALEEGVDGLDVKVSANQGIADIFMKWAKYRLGLEVQIAKIEREEHKLAIHKLDLIILARQNFDTIKKALDQEDSAEFIAKKLKIDLDDAKYIMSRTLTNLSKTDIEATENKIVEMKQKIKTCNARIKNPAPSAVEALEAIADLSDFDAETGVEETETDE